LVRPVDESGNGLDLEDGMFAVRVIRVSSVTTPRYWAFDENSSLLLVQRTVDEGIGCERGQKKVRIRQWKCHRTRVVISVPDLQSGHHLTHISSLLKSEVITTKRDWFDWRAMDACSATTASNLWKFGFWVSYGLYRYSMAIGRSSWESQRTGRCL